MKCNATLLVKVVFGVVCLFGSCEFALAIPAPRDLQISAGMNGLDVILSWSYIHQDSADGFIIYKSGSVFDSIVSDTTAYIDYSCSVGYYWITAYRGGEESTPSNSVSDTVIPTPNIQIWEFFVPGEHAGFGWDTLNGIGNTNLCVPQNADLIDFFFCDLPPLCLFSADEPPYGGNKTTHILNMGTSDFSIAPSTGYYNIEYVIEGNFYSICTEEDHWAKLHISFVDSVYPENIIFDANYQLVQSLRLFGSMVGIEEEKKEHISYRQKLKISPNPFSEFAMIDFGKRRIDGNTKVKTYDIAGKLVKEYNISSERVQIGYDLLPGVYFLRIDGYMTEKMVKLKR